MAPLLRSIGWGLLPLLGDRGPKAVAYLGCCDYSEGSGISGSGLPSDGHPSSVAAGVSCGLPDQDVAAGNVFVTGCHIAR